MCFRGQFLHKMWPFWLAFLLCIVCLMFLSCLVEYNASSLLIQSIQKIFSILLQHQIIKLCMYFWSTFQSFITIQSSSLNLSPFCWWKWSSLAMSILDLISLIPRIRKVAVHLGYGRVQLNCDGTWWCRVGEVKGKLANGVGSHSNAVYVDLVVSVPCVTVCRHISTGPYHSLSVQLLMLPKQLKYFTFFSCLNIISEKEMIPGENLLWIYR